MKKIAVFILLLSVLKSFSIVIPNNNKRSDSDIDVPERFRISSGKTLFDIDDSLLRTDYPETGILSTKKLPTRDAFSHSLQFHYTPNNSTLPNYLIITPQTLYQSLSLELSRYAEDVHTIYGYGIILETTINGTPEDIKALILSYQSNLCGVFLIGDLGEAKYEISNDHNEYGYRNWPCDLFFMDIDGIWTDSNNNGRYDHHTGNVAPDIFMGRLSATGMSSLGDEVTLIRMQLQKSHNYWWKSSYSTSNTVLNYIDDDWANYYCMSYDISPVFASGNVTDIQYGLSPLFSSNDYLSRLSNNQYGFTHLAAHSSPDRHRFTNGNEYGYVYVYDIKQNTSNNYAYNLFCCSACNWTLASTEGYLGGAYLFNSGKTISVVGSTKTGGMMNVSNFYSQFPSKNIGQSLLHWWNVTYGNSHTNSDISWSYGMTLLGDPTINFRHQVSDFCTDNLVLDSYPTNNNSNLLMYKAESSINVSADFIIPQGVHVIFDAPQITFANGFNCPLGASFETRNEGCEL